MMVRTRVIPFGRPHPDGTNKKKDSTDYEPLPPRITEYDEQLASPFFDGRCPPEIRRQIFSYALSETRCLHKTDEFPTHHFWKLDSHFARPGYQHWKEIPISLLLTCRRIYLEAYDIPFENKEHVFWIHRTPWDLLPRHLHPTTYERQYLGRFRDDQLRLIKSVHFHFQMYCLEDAFSRITQNPGFRWIEYVKITIRRGDWWHWEDNVNLYLSPTVKWSLSRGRMDPNWNQEDAAKEIPGQGWPSTSWGNGFRHMPNLKEVEMELETSEDKKEELAGIVRRAKHWKFPLNDGMYLSNAGTKIKSWTWQGPFCLWSDRCTECNRLDREAGRDINCQTCRDKAFLTDNGKGPKLVVTKIRWIRTGDQEGKHPFV